MKIIYRITYPNPWWSNRRRMAAPEAAMTLGEILELVGPLDDSPGENTSKDCFRAHLAKSVTAPGALRGRGYIETCLRAPSPQHARALQDLVNHCGRLLGFQVAFGRYQGVVNETGHDGLWKSPGTGFTIVPEIKTTDAGRHQPDAGVPVARTGLTGV